jgi:4-carboxymuconolactone decarboxylase
MYFCVPMGSSWSWVSAATKHEKALETHILKAKEAGVTDEEIKHALLLLITTAGFPTFMEAYSVFKNIP